MRDSSKLETKIIDSCTIIQWNATHVEDISTILASWIDVLIHTISVPFFHSKPTLLYSSVTWSVIKAWKEKNHECKHYIVMSSFWTHHGRRLLFPFNIGYEYFLGDVADDKEKEEQLLLESNLPWTVMKAVLLNDVPTSSYIKTSFELFTPSVRQRISRTAVAHALLDAAWDTDLFASKIVISCDTWKR